MFGLHERLKNNESGFTLVELLVVILIIGVLTAIAVPVFLNQRKSATEASMKSDMHTIQSAMENCYIKSSPYPDIWINWAGTTKIPSCVTGITLSDGSRTHSFDFGSIYPAAGVQVGTVYCIEMASFNVGTVFYFRSDKGSISTTQCQYQ